MSKEHDDWNFKLRVIGTTPDTIPLERLGEYMKEFAKLLGTSSCPTFAGMKNESASTLARLPASSIQIGHCYELLKAKQSLQAILEEL